MTLKQFFEENPRAAVAFSGGTDSAFLLWCAKHAGAEVTAYFVRTAFQPAFEREDARRLARELGVPLREVCVDILSVADVAKNDARRCYYCKRALFSAIWAAARADGHTLLLDGTNATDSETDRPGMAALRELAVRSPLREAGIGKGEVRRRSKQAGLFTWDKPAYACLATRVPTGTALTKADLARAEGAEDALRALGFRDFRVRLMGAAARLELTAGQLAGAVEKREAVCAALLPWCSAVLLDLKPRMEEELP